MSGTRKIPLQDAKSQQLRTFARDHLGIKFPFGVTDEQMRAQIKAAHEGDITVSDDAAEPAVKRPVGRPPRAPAPAAVRPLTEEAAPEGWLEAATGGFYHPDNLAMVEGRLYPIDHPIEILIPMQNEPGGREPVSLGVNGRAILVPRGKKVQLAAKYVHDLENALEDRYEQVKDDAIGKTEMVKTKVHRYPYQLFGI